MEDYRLRAYKDSLPPELHPVVEGEVAEGVLDAFGHFSSRGRNKYLVHLWLDTAIASDGHIRSACLRVAGRHARLARSAQL